MSPEKKLRYKLLSNVHDTLIGRVNNEEVVKGCYDYYHYKCDGVNDCGWGCGYRTLQTICSWLINNKKFKDKTVPTIENIQEILIEIGDKPKSFLSSSQWIGSVEIGMVIDHLFDVPCRIIHIPAGKESFAKGVKNLWLHFETYGSPVMMGGDQDAASKCLLGIRQDELNSFSLLVLDPHCSKVPSTEKELLESKWVCWRQLNTFDTNSFYNLCLPLAKVLKD